MKPRSEWTREVNRLNTPEGPLFPYLVEEVLEKETREVRELLAAVAPLPGFNASLCHAVGVDRAVETVPLIARRRLYVEPVTRGNELLVLSLMIRELMVSSATPEEEVARIRRASDWYRERFPA